MSKKYNCGRNHPKFIDLEGRTIGSLKVLKYVLHKGRGDKERWVWECQCNCGNISYVRTTKLIKENPQTSCKACSDDKFSKNNVLPEYQAIKNRVLRRYKRAALLRGYEFKLSKEYFESLLMKDCYYCGSKPRPYDEDKSYYNGLEPLCRNGIDRVDNTLGYVDTNVVTCCSKCNTAKMDNNIDDFKSWIKQVHDNLLIKSSTTIPQGSTSQANGDGNGDYPGLTNNIFKLKINNSWFGNNDIV